jgi:hypothetical protein
VKHRSTFPLPALVLSMLGASLATVGAAQVPASVPAQVRARIAALDTRCKAAGGQPLTQPYVYVHDYSGDGRPDYLVSEGNYGCSSKPTLFRNGEAAVIEVFVTQADGSAIGAWHGSVIAYRLLDRKPTAIQVAQTGTAACGTAARCGFTLRWDGTRGFVADPVGAPATAPAAPAAVVTGTLVPQTQVEVMATCKTRLMKEGSDAKNAQSNCAFDWERLGAATPMAKAVMALMAQPLASARTVAGAKAAMTGIKWHARNEPPVAPMTIAVEGDLGNLSVFLTGKGAVDSVTFEWGEPGGVSPYDLPAALRFQGVKLSPIACGTGGDAFGNSTTNVLRVEVPGAVPFAIDVNQRDAPIGGQQGWYLVTINPGGRMPTAASLRAENSSTDPIEAVQWGQCQ